MNVTSQETNAIALKNDNCACPNCGSEKRFKFHSHADGRDYVNKKASCINYYYCVECDTEIYFKTYYDYPIEIKLIEKIFDQFVEIENYTLSNLHQTKKKFDIKLEDIYSVYKSKEWFNEMIEPLIEKGIKIYKML